MRTIPLLIIIFNLIVSNIYAQNSSRKKKRKNEIESQYNKSQSPQIKQPVSKGLNRTTDNSSLAIPDSPSDILDYFINEKQSNGYISFWAENKKDTLIHVDSLLPINKGYINSFIKRYDTQKHKSSDELKNTPFKNIYNEITELAKINYRKRNQKQVNEVLVTIEQLRNSRQKLELLLFFASLNIRNETYYSDVYSFCYKAKKYADGINDLYEKGKAYTSIADFAYSYKINEFAIQLYYLARELFDNCKKDSITKYNEQGFICEKLAWVFYSINLEQAFEKEGYYLANANHNFVKSGNVKQSAITAFHTLTVAAQLWIDYRRGDPSDSDIETQLQTLIELQRWYKKSRGIALEADFLGFFATAIAVEEKSKKISLLYYQNALYYATLGLNLDHVIACLENIVTIYTSLGEQNIAIGYSNLELYLVSKTSFELDYNTALLNKAYTLYKVSDYDSAIIYVNNILSDTNLKNIFYPAFYNQILEEAYLVKFRALDSLKQSDSARKYERIYIGYQTQHLRNLVSLIEVESKSISEWFERSKGREIGNEKELRVTAEKNGKLQEGLKKQEEKLKIQAIEKGTQDSIRRVQSDSLLSLKESLRKADSTTNAKDKVNIKREEEAIRNSLVSWGVGVLLLITSLYFIGANYIQKKRRKAENKSKEEELKRTKSEMKLLSMLAINHDIDKFIPHLPLFLKDTTDENKESLQKVVEDFKEYYWATKQLGDSLTNTIKNEIAIARKSAEVYLYMARSKTIPHIDTNFEGNAEIESLEIPKNMIASFIANSVKYGRVGKKSISVFISVKKNQNVFTVTIEDDGVGFKSLNLENNPPDKGINLVIKQTQNFNENNNHYQIQFSPGDINNKPNNTGVIVTFKLIKL